MSVENRAFSYIEINSNPAQYWMIKNRTKMLAQHRTHKVRLNKAKQNYIT